MFEESVTGGDGAHGGGAPSSPTYIHTSILVDGLLNTSAPLGLLQERAGLGPHDVSLDSDKAGATTAGRRLSETPSFSASRRDQLSHKSYVEAHHKLEEDHRLREANADEAGRHEDLKFVRQVDAIVNLHPSWGAPPYDVFVPDRQRQSDVHGTDPTPAPAPSVFEDPVRKLFEDATAPPQPPLAAPAPQPTAPFVGPEMPSPVQPAPGTKPGGASTASRTASRKKRSTGQRTLKDTKERLEAALFNNQQLETRLKVALKENSELLVQHQGMLTELDEKVDQIQALTREMVRISPPSPF